jgi:ElaA protein
VDVRDAALAELDPVKLYGILALRCAVFVVEQECAYLDLDGRDLEPSARQLWIANQDGEVVATLRLVIDFDGTYRIGRVATAAAARGMGLAADLMHRALELIGYAPSALEAQSYLVDWYGRFGYVPSGDPYVEDGILHTPMFRAPSADSGTT